MVLIKMLLNKRKTLEIKKIPNSHYDEGYLGKLKSSPNSAGFWAVGSGEEFYCDMHLPLLNLDLGWGGFI